MLAFVFTGIALLIVGYVVKVLTSTSGSELKGNALDDFILCGGKLVDKPASSFSREVLL